MTPRRRKTDHRNCVRCGRVFGCRSDSRTRFCSFRCVQPPASATIAANTRRTPSGCLVWTGKASGRYPAFKFNGRTQKAHRIAWQIKRGAIPAGAYVCHSCDNTLCVDVEHLFLGTQRENMHDMTAKRRAWFAPSIELHDGTLISVAEACRVLAVPYGRTIQRLKLGWTVGRAVCAPQNMKGRHAHA